MRPSIPRPGPPSWPVTAWAGALLVLLALLCSPHPAAAHSHRPGPLKRLLHPTDMAISVLPRTPPLQPRHLANSTHTFYSPSVLHSDSIRISLQLPDTGEQVHLHLEPNDELLHPRARVNYHRGGRVVRSEKLQREHYRAYTGVVVHTRQTERRLAEDTARIVRTASWEGVPEEEEGVLGWARIMLHDDGVSTSTLPLFEGVFTLRGERHHIKTLPSYLASKHASDPSPDLDAPSSKLVIFRDGDVEPAEGSHSHSDHPFRTGCSAEQEPFNTNASINPALRDPSFYALRPLPPLLSALDAFLGSPASSKFDPRDPSAGPFVRFAPTSPDLLDRAEEGVRLRKRQGAGDISGGTGGTNFVNSIGDSMGCPTDQKILYMGFAADCTYVGQYGSPEKARTQILNNVNQISALYRDIFRTSIGVIELNVQDSVCPPSASQSEPWNVACSDSVTINERLSRFAQWRGAKGDDGAGLWHLMTNCATGSEVGVAWLGTLCRQDARSQDGNTVSGVAVTAITRTEWAVSAHEIGHNFGAIHDCETGCSSSTYCCPLTTNSCNADNKFIMSATSSDAATMFSNCSVGNICSLLGSGQVTDDCLVDASDNSRQIISLQQCGNGIIEGDEECDGGGETNCCGTDCKFKSGAVCDNSTGACCTESCQFAPSTQVCRPSMDSTCDVEEKCTGNSGTCPTDVFAENGKSCGDGLHCASGMCTSADQQCKSAGASLGLTTACDMGGDSTCLVTCNDPSGRGCIRLQTPLRDGTSCGYGGTCEKGHCKSGSWQDTFRSWYTQNLRISIPVTIVVGIIVLIILYSMARCIINGCRRRNAPPSAAYTGAPVASRPGMSTASRLRRGNKGSIPPYAHSPTQAPLVAPPQGQQFGVGSDYGAPPPPPVPPRAFNPPPQRSNWVDPAAYNGHGYVEEPSYRRY